jgi:thiopeptide-type bacteriocin biosynthesis protein
MPADHLTASVPQQLAKRVHAVLTGADPATIAAELGIRPADLDDAVRTYHAGGLAALEQRGEHNWYDVRVEFPDWATAETPGATQLGPALDRLHQDGALTGWWFLRKHPCWRLRLHGADTVTTNHVLNDLTTAGHLARWWPTIYEPEMTAFGGTTGMTIVHELFQTDTRGVLDHLRHGKPSLGRRELTTLLLAGLFHGTGMDVFERGDVFDRVAQLRPLPAEVETGQINQLANSLRGVVTCGDPTRTDLFHPDGPAGHAAAWLAAFQQAGHQLGHTAASGRLGRGLRAILTHVVIFHWNRLGLSAASQAILARAAAVALLPRD